MPIKIISFFIVVSASFFCASCSNNSAVSESAFPWVVDSSGLGVTQFVDPMIGTAGHGHTYPGATAPFGMVQLSPDTRIDGSWDGCSGYHYDDSLIYGFSHTHLSGTGCSDYGDIMLMPGIVNKSYSSGADTSNTATGYRQPFSHDNEVAEAGYYSVKLDNGIMCEMTASPRVGVHRYNFYQFEEPWIILDMSHRDEVLECEIEIVNDHTIRGKRFSKAWASNQQLWFYAEFSEPFTHEFWSKGETLAGDSSTAKDLKAIFSFTSEQVEVKVALSPVSWANAKLNMEVETGEMNFDAIKEKVQRNWDAELSRIEIETPDESKKTIFYTSLYHCFIAPNVYCDVNGDYQGMDHKVYRDTVHQRYSVFSLWDTYRALHPLFTIVQQKRTNDFINTFLQQYKESGRLPVWELSSNETDCMIGYHSVSVIADAWMKGIVGYDTSLALDAMIASAMENRSGLESYRKCGFIPGELESESVSKTLEYAYDDWCIARCAERSGKEKAAAYFYRRSNNWKNLYNPETGFLQARMNNSFVTPFTPAEVNFHYTEANAWQYSMAVQHDIPGLVRLHGGAAEFETHLDSMFSASSQTTGRDQADISGLIGQYAHGNEPSHHMAYLYSSIYEDHKTQKLVHEICNTLYTDKPDGLCGNEDCGQMSAWYVMSSAGFYQVTPGKPEYTVGSPQFSRSKIHLENGKTFEITTSGTEIKNAYCHVVGADNSEYTSYKLGHEKIMSGGAFQIEKHDTIYKNITFNPTGIQPDGVSAPWITGATSRTFVDRLSLGMKTLFASNKIYYSINNGEFMPYTSAISITENSTVRMYSEGNSYKPETEIIYARDLADPKNIVGKMYSDTVQANFFKAPAWKSISIRNAFAPQYSAGGNRALIDGMTGTTNFRTGLWQGYEGVDLNVVIDLGKTYDVESISINFLHDQKSWIFLPNTVMFAVSDKPETTTWTYGMKDSNYDPMSEASFIDKESMDMNKTGRYVLINASNFGTCPKGHSGVGKPAWLFADEITIKTK